MKASQSNSPVSLEMRRVSYEIDDRTLLRETSLHFTGPKAIGVLGPSGCGKTTLLRLLSGLQKPSSGQILHQCTGVGFVFQEPHLLDWLSTIENVSLPLEFSSKNESCLDPLEALALVELNQAQDLYPRELSGGMKMRASLARALVTKPNLLFFDEPLSALDEITRENIQDRLRDLQETHNWLSFFVTHTLTEALSLCDEIYIFEAPGTLSKIPMIIDRQGLRGEEFRESQLFIEQLKALKEKIKVLKP